MKKFHLPLLWVVFALLFLGGCAESDPSDTTKPSMTVSVMLQESEGIVISGENPVSVEVGKDVSFAVKIRDGYKIEQIGQGAVYEDGKLTLKNVKFPTTLEIATRTLYDLSFGIHNNSQQGDLAANVESGTVREDTLVTLNATPKKDLIFLGYSLGAPQSDGGTIVCASPEYTFTLTENTVLYTNYFNIAGGRLVVYDGNGAKEGTQYYLFPNTSPYIGPNALANKGQFTREGYVLYGYNTEPDGSGTYYGPGWSVILPEDRNAPLTLYAQWLPVTEKEAFTYTVTGKEVTITHYQGNHKTVVIPETIDGMPVVKIAARTFVNGNFKTVYLSRNLLTVENEAFSGCKSLTTLYMCDTPSSMKDAAFTDCDNLQKLYMLACIDPRYSKSNNGTYKMKYQRLLTAQGKKIIFHAGSNVSYGLDISTVQEKLDSAYAGVNFGCNLETPAVFFVEVAAAHTNPGDIVVLCPEYHKYQYGYNEMNTTTWQIFEGAYNAYADVDIRHFTRVFSSFATFNTHRYRSSAKTYEMYHTVEGIPSVSKFGEHNINHNGQTPALIKDIAKWEAGEKPQTIDISLLSKSYNAKLNRAIDMVLDKGGKVYISFAVIMKQAVTEEHLHEAYLQSFKAAVINAFPGAAVISDPAAYVLDKNMFYNSDYHLSTDASKVRAEMLAKDILAQFEKEK